MTILLLRQYNPYTENSASANRFRGLIDGLRTLGQKLDIVVINGFVSPIEKQHDYPNVKYLCKANHYSYWWSRLNTYLFDRLYEKLVCVRLKRLNFSDYDIVWLSNTPSVLNCYLKCKKNIITKTFVELNEFNDIKNESDQTNKMIQKIRRFCIKDRFADVVCEIDMFGVMTQTLLQYYQSMAKPDAKFLHLPMTVELKRFENVRDSAKYQKPYIAFTGTMDNAKDGVDVLIKSFAKIADTYKNVHLYLAGFWYYDVPSQDELIRHYGLDERIHRLGVLGRDEIPPFICNASVLALARPDSHQAQGGFPTKLGEYLATGNPVCVTSVGEIPDYLEDNISAFFAKPGDVDSFSEALNRALSDFENAKRVGLNGRMVAENNFSAELQAKRLADFLQNS